MNAFPAAEISDRRIPAKAFQYNANLFFCGELAAGDAFYILAEFLGFFTSGFSLPEAFRECDVSRNPSYAQELVRNTGQMGVPVTIINGQTVVGFDRGRLEQLLAQTQTRQGSSLGASIADASRITAKGGSGIILGAYVGRIRPGSVAERIGLVTGDIITELNMKRIANASDLEHALWGPRQW